MSHKIITGHNVACNAKKETDIQGNNAMADETALLTVQLGVTATTLAKLYVTNNGCHRQREARFQGQLKDSTLHSTNGIGISESCTAAAVNATLLLSLLNLVGIPDGHPH